ncbi:MAG: FtsX-like permease family protein, partial [Verrucomicrobiota bacterium]
MPVGIFPVLEVSAARADAPEAGLLKIVGTDLVLLRNLSNYVERDTKPLSGSGFGRGESSGDGDEEGGNSLGSVGDAFITTRLAEREELTEKDAFSVVIDDTATSLNVSGILPDLENQPEAPDNLLVMDLPGLQELTQRPRELSRVEFRIPPGQRREQLRFEAAARLAGFAEDRGLILERPEDRESSVTQMSAAFRLNLTILSGLALLVGLYLIMQAMEAAVVKRRQEIAVLRSLGVTPREIRTAWLLEGLVLGIVGASMGIVMGRLLAEGLVGAIARTVNTLYYETTTQSIQLGMGEILFCLVFGIAASLLAVFIPARDASSTPPAQSLKRSTPGGGLSLLRNRNLGYLFLGVGIVCSLLPPFRSETGSVIPLGGYIASVVFVLAASFLIGQMFPLVVRFLKAFRPGAGRSYAASQLAQARGRHRLTAAGLAVAIGMSAAMGILVASFETTLTQWIGQLLKADVYVAAPGASSVNNENTIARETWEGIVRTNGVAGADRLRRYPISLRGQQFFLGGADYNVETERYLQMIWLDEPADTGPLALEVTEQSSVPPAWASEALTRHFGVGKGSPFPGPTPSGEQVVKIEGVFADYGNEMGTLIVARELT